MDNNGSVGPPRGDWQRAAAAIALIIILAFAVVARTRHIQGGLWPDEIITYKRSMQPLPQVMRSGLYPLYYVLTHYALAFGDQESTIRLPSILAGVAGVLAMYFAGKSLHGRAAGLIAALFLATSDVHIYRSQQARYYTLMILFGVLIAWLLHRAATRGGFWNWALCALTACVGVLSHLFLALYLAAMAAGVFLWLLVSRGFPDWRHKLRRMGALCLCIAVGLSGVLSLCALQGSLPLSLLQTPQWRAQATPEPAEQGADAAAPTPAPAKAAKGKAYKLGVKEYIGFVEELVPVRSGHLLILYIALAIWGLARLAFKRPPFAALAFFAVVCLPIPLFLIHVTHSLEHRYFSVALPLITLVVAWAIADLGAVAAHWLGGKRAGLATQAAVVLLILAVLSPPVYGQMRHHLATSTEDYRPWDWKGVAGFMSPRLTFGDVVALVIPEKDATGLAFPLDFYLRRAMANGPAILSSLNFRYGIPTVENMNGLFREFPFTNIWIVRRSDRPMEKALRNRLDAAGTEWRTFRKTEVGVLGAPTANLAPWGGFEGERAAAIIRPPMQLVGGPGVYDGERALQLEITDTDYAEMLIPFIPSQYRLRNGGFEAWEGNTPSGWQADEASGPHVTSSEEASEGRRALSLSPGGAAVCVKQPIALALLPGNALTLSAQGQAAAPNQLALTLAYEVDGETRRAGVWHPGGGSWQTLSLREEVPQDTAPNSFVIECWAQPSNGAPSHLDDVTIEVDRGGVTLSPYLDYTLSFALKQRDIPYSRMAWIGLVGRDAAGEPFRKTILWAPESRDWYDNTIPIQPGKDFPLGIKDLALGLGLRRKRGVVWLDNVQLEANGQATPFTQGARSPHDETPG